MNLQELSKATISSVEQMVSVQEQLKLNLLTPELGMT